MYKRQLIQGHETSVFLGHSFLRRFEATGQFGRATAFTSSMEQVGGTDTGPEQSSNAKNNFVFFDSSIETS